MYGMYVTVIVDTVVEADGFQCLAVFECRQLLVCDRLRYRLHILSAARRIGICDRIDLIISCCHDIRQFLLHVVEEVSLHVLASAVIHKVIHRKSDLAEAGQTFQIAVRINGRGVRQCISDCNAV